VATTKEQPVKSKFSVVVLVLATGALLVSPAFAGGGAETKVKIKAESGGFYGYVKSDKPKCANGREVTLYKQKGNGADPSSDKRIGSDIAQPNGDRYMWSTGNTGYRKGYFYAYAEKENGCKAGISKSIKAQK
jgi:hypothetical protein